MTDNQLKKLRYIEELLATDQGIDDPSKTVWQDRELMSLAKARQVAASGILPNPYIIEGWSPNGMGPGNIAKESLSPGRVRSLWLKFLNKAIPDKFPWLLPKYCLEAIGDIHDLRYVIGGGRNVRARADDEFRRLIQIAGRGLSWYNRFRLWRISWIYFAFVRGFGPWFFNFIKRRK